MMVLQVLKVGILRHLGIPLLLGGIDGDQVFGSSSLALMMVRLWASSCRSCWSVSSGTLVSPSCLGGLKGDQVGNLLLLLLPGVDDGQALGLLLQVLKVGLLRHLGILLLLGGLEGNQVCAPLLLLLPDLDDGQALGFLLQVLQVGILGHLVIPHLLKESWGQSGL